MVPYADSSSFRERTVVETNGCAVASMAWSRGAFASRPPKTQCCTVVLRDAHASRERQIVTVLELVGRAPGGETPDCGLLSSTSPLAQRHTRSY